MYRYKFVQCFGQYLYGVKTKGKIKILLIMQIQAFQQKNCTGFKSIHVRDQCENVQACIIAHISDDNLI